MDSRPLHNYEVYLMQSSTRSHDFSLETPAITLKNNNNNKKLKKQPSNRLSECKITESHSPGFMETYEGHMFSVLLLKKLSNAKYLFVLGKHNCLLEA